MDAAAMVSKNRVDYLLIVRAFAAFCVLTQHVMWTLLPRQFPALLTLGSLNLSWIPGGCDVSGVYLFFCLSGYLMGKGFFRGRYVPSQPLRFYWRRFFRIMPAYLVYLAFVFTVGGLAFNYPRADVIVTLTNLLRLTYAGYEGIPGSQFLGHLWSISTEMQFYLVVPIFALAMAAWCAKLKTRAVAVVIATVLILGCAHRFYVFLPHRFGIWHDNAYVSMFANLDLFLGGMLVNFLPLERFKMSFGRQIALLFGSIAAMYLVCSYITYYSRIMAADLTGWFAYGLPTVTAIFAVWLVYIAERINSGDAPSAQWARYLQPLAYGGTITFSFYLWHEYFLEHAQMFITISEQPLLTYIVRFLAVGVVSGVVASISYRFVEKPFMNLRFPSGLFRSLRPKTEDAL